MRWRSTRWCLAAAASLLLACPVPDEPDPVEDPTPEEPEPLTDQTFLPVDYQPVAPQRILFLGDSITASGGSLSYRPLLLENRDDVWPEYAGLDLATLYPDMTEAVNVASGGSTTSRLVEQQLPQLDEIFGGPVAGETMTVLTIGGNDMQLALASVLADQYELAELRVDTLLDNMELMFDHLLDAERFGDGNRVYLANVYDPSDGQGVTEGCFGGFDLSVVLPLLDEANEGILALAEERGVAMVDMRYHFAGHGYGHDPDEPPPDPDDPDVWFEPDCIHPNDRGHHEIRRLFYAAIEGEPLD